jgi:hypothetical protein
MQAPGFEEHMAAGGAAHQATEYGLALQLRVAAYAEAPSDSIDAGRAARDIAAALDRRRGFKAGADNPVSDAILAGAYAEHAYRIHSKLADNKNASTYDPNALRELEPSAMYMAIASMRQALHRSIRKQFQGPNVSGFSKGALRAESLNYSREAEKIGRYFSHINRKWHQFDVNASGRIAGIEGLCGDPQKAAPLGDIAVKLATLSETQALLGTSVDNSPEKIAQAQRKAAWRARGAVMVCRMSARPLRRLVTRPIANKIIDRIVL